MTPRLRSLLRLLPLLLVAFSAFAFDKPSNPVITGPASVTVGTAAAFDFVSTPGAGDSIHHYIYQWSDTNQYVANPDAQGHGQAARTFTAVGNYSLKVAACGSGWPAVQNWSGWSTFTFFVAAAPPPPGNLPPSVPAAPAGPAVIGISQSGAYAASATDPNGDNVRYTFYWGDGAQNTSGWVASGTPASLSHAWTAEGTYSVKVMATDVWGASSAWSAPTAVTVTNTPPLTPGAPSGPGYRILNESGAYSARTTDPNGDNVCYTFDWGDGSQNTTGWVASGTSASLSHAWPTAGTYSVRVMATDRKGAVSEWSAATPVTVAINVPPTVPGKPSGPTYLQKGTVATYTSSGSLDASLVRYVFDFGDAYLPLEGGGTGWMSPGVPVSMQHDWLATGVYAVRVKAVDQYGLSSAWSAPLYVKIAK